MTQYFRHTPCFVDCAYLNVSLVNVADQIPTWTKRCFMCFAPFYWKHVKRHKQHIIIDFVSSQIAHEAGSFS